ncbi:UPF0183 protein, partial [Mucuna pruriens]
MHMNASNALLVLLRMPCGTNSNPGSRLGTTLQIFTSTISHAALIGQHGRAPINMGVHIRCDFAWTYIEPTSYGKKVGVGFLMNKASTPPLPTDNIYMEEVQVKLGEELKISCSSCSKLKA